MKTILTGRPNQTNDRRRTCKCQREMSASA